MNVMVRYDNGVQLNYALSAYDAWEGYRIAFNGTKGRIEHRIVETAGVACANEIQSKSGGVSTRVIPLRGAAREIEPWTGTGGHGGGDGDGDDAMLAEIFGAAPPDKFKRVSDKRAGAWSALVRIVA